MAFYLTFHIQQDLSFCQFVAFSWVILGDVSLDSYLKYIVCNYWVVCQIKRSVQKDINTVDQLAWILNELLETDAIFWVSFCFYFCFCFFMYHKEGSKKFDRLYFMQFLLIIKWSPPDGSESSVNLNGVEWLILNWEKTSHLLVVLHCRMASHASSFDLYRV